MSMFNVSGNGTLVNLIASVTFPVGILLSDWSDDADPVDMPAVQFGDATKGVNGDLIVWSKANPLDLTLNVIPGSSDDVLLSILMQANFPGKFKINTRDIITANIVYPDGSFVFLSSGIITSGMPGASVASAGRLKTKAYMFKFDGFSAG